MQKNYAADITLVEDEDEALQVECVEPHLSAISLRLRNAGFNVGNPTLQVAGTSNLLSVMKLPVADGSFDAMKAAINTSLLASRVVVTGKTSRGWEKSGFASIWTMCRFTAIRAEENPRYP